MALKGRQVESELLSLGITECDLKKENKTKQKQQPKKKPCIISLLQNYEEKPVQTTDSETCVRRTCKLGGHPKNTFHLFRGSNELFLFSLPPLNGHFVKMGQVWLVCL